MASKMISSRIFKTILKCSKKKYCTIPSSNAEHSLSNYPQNIKIGDKISIQRKITQDDILNFAKITNDYNPIHIKSTKNVVHGAFLNGLVSGIIGTKLPGPGTIVLEQVLRFPKPCYVDDTVELSVEIVSVRKIIKCKYVCIANSERVVMEGEAKLMTNANIVSKSFVYGVDNDIVLTEIPTTVPYLQSESVPESPTQENKTTLLNSSPSDYIKEPIGCTCGIFLSGQALRGRKEPPKGNAALLHENPDPFPCTNSGNRMCTNKCLDVVVKHLPNSASILCGSIDRDCYRERAYLFIKNCKDEWMNTNLSAGREYCCKDGLPYKCNSIIPIN